MFSEASSELVVNCHQLKARLVFTSIYQYLSVLALPKGVCGSAVSVQPEPSGAKVRRLQNQFSLIELWNQTEGIQHCMRFFSNYNLLCPIERAARKDGLSTTACVS